MNDFASFEKTIVRELSCRLCLCNDVVKLKPLNAELKRKIKKLFDVNIRNDDSLPKAICHECLQQVGALHLYTVKVEKTQKFLEFHKTKSCDFKLQQNLGVNKFNPIIAALSSQNLPEQKINTKEEPPVKPVLHSELQQGDAKILKSKPKKKKESDLKYLEAMPLDEFAKTESVDRSLLDSVGSPPDMDSEEKKNNTEVFEIETEDTNVDTLDPIVIVDGRPAKQGAALDKQITLFYKMECCICHERGFNFRSLMKHYKDRHGVPGYVTCCEKKFHYFYPKKIIEHMAYHLQPNIFMCKSCHQSFQTSHDLVEHQSNGGRSEGKIVCPRCADRYPTYHELGLHIISHRSDTLQCDYCGKLLKHHHRKKTVNRMEDVILCSQCIRTLKNIEKQEKEIKEKIRNKNTDTVTIHKYHKFRQAMGLSPDEDESTE